MSYEPLRNRVGHLTFLEKMSYRLYEVGTLVKFLVTLRANSNPLYAEDPYLALGIIVNDFDSQNGLSQETD